MTLINEINLQNNDLKEQIFKDISTKLNEIERKNEEQITLDIKSLSMFSEDTIFG